MSYTKPQTLDASPSGDTVKAAIVNKLDVNAAQIVSDLNTHEALTETHGATGAVVGTTNTQTLTNKTLTAPTITGAGAIAGVFTGNITGNVTGNVIGNVTGNVTGNCTGSSGSCTGNAATASACTGNAATASSCAGNAATATKLETARTIGGVSFDGSANITVSSATSGFAVTGTCSATAFSGPLTGAVTGNVTGNCTGSSGSCTGNAATATTATTVSDSAITAAKLLQPTAAGTEIYLARAETERATNVSSYTKIKETAALTRGGAVTVSFVGKCTELGDCHAKVYKNGSAVGTERTLSSSETTFSENFTAAIGDVFQVYAKSSDGGYLAYAKNLYVTANDPYCVREAGGY